MSVRAIESLTRLLAPDAKLLRDDEDDAAAGAVHHDQVGRYRQGVAFFDACQDDAPNMLNPLDPVTSGGNAWHTLMLC
jgi:hypothetical protein